MKTYTTGEDENGFYAAVTENGVTTKTYYPNSMLAAAAMLRWQQNEVG